MKNYLNRTDIWQCVAAKYTLWKILSNHIVEKVMYCNAVIKFLPSIVIKLYQGHEIGEILYPCATLSHSLVFKKSHSDCVQVLLNCVEEISFHWFWEISYHCVKGILLKLCFGEFQVFKKSCTFVFRRFHSICFKKSHLVVLPLCSRTACGCCFSRWWLVQECCHGDFPWWFAGCAVCGLWEQRDSIYQSA